MRILFTTALCLLLAAVALGADKIQQIIDQGPVTKEALAVLTTNDVPARWRTRVEQKDHAKGTIRSFYRGQEKILQVLWLKEWSGSKSNMFSASVYHGTRAVAGITSLSTNGTSITQTKDSSLTHLVVTTIADDGKVSVFVKDDQDYFQCITVSGRNTRLLDDLEYTKERVHWEQVGRPLAEEVIGFLKPFKDRADQYNQSRTNR